MRLDYWLHEATGPFPPGVRRRLAKEYGAHLADSILAGGTTDAFELFGDPGKVRKGLGKSYVTENDPRSLKKQTHWRSTIAALLMLSTLVNKLDSMQLYFFVAIALILTALTLRVLSSLQKARRAKITQALLLSLYVSSGALFSLTLEHLGISKQSLILSSIAVASYGWTVFSTIQEDRRIRRTLEVQRLR